ncbi:hypothetical protein CEXT_257361 [Caerostris extrusa]|uniref:Uncharacterized protein n=1 Tax=Caerostris extrusa TaxID=172846 RepID=A0AAV4RK06_CAEEX|nr:hypothetical protein CEXT_257361 [Caerostris extrusa]
MTQDLQPLRSGEKVSCQMGQEVENASCPHLRMCASYPARDGYDAGYFASNFRPKFSARSTEKRIPKNFIAKIRIAVSWHARWDSPKKKESDILISVFSKRELEITEETEPDSNVIVTRKEFGKHVS